MTILRKILRAGVNVQDKAPKIRSRSNAWEKPIPPAPSTVACLRHMKETNLLEPEGSLHHPPAHCPPPSPPPGLMGPPSCLPIKGLSRKPSTPLPHHPQRPSPLPSSSSLPTHYSRCSQESQGRRGTPVSPTWLTEQQRS